MSKSFLLSSLVYICECKYQRNVSLGSNPFKTRNYKSILQDLSGESIKIVTSHFIKLIPSNFDKGPKIQ